MGGGGRLAQEKNSDPSLDSTLFCSTEELQGGWWGLWGLWVVGVDGVGISCSLPCCCFCVIKNLVHDQGVVVVVVVVWRVGGCRVGRHNIR